MIQSGSRTNTKFINSASHDYPPRKVIDKSVNKTANPHRVSYKE